MTRIIAGEAGGRRLQTPFGAQTRPTSDRVREAMFASIASWCGSLTGLRVLDLYAGSGALALEARSRGAGVVTMVEHDRKTAQLIRKNVATLGFTRADVVVSSVAQALARPPVTPYDLVLFDPPYPLAEEALAADLAALVEHGWLVPGALVVIERGRRSPEPLWPSGLVFVRMKRYGETTLWYGHAETAERAEPAVGADLGDEG